MESNGKEEAKKDIWKTVKVFQSGQPILIERATFIEFKVSDNGNIISCIADGGSRQYQVYGECTIIIETIADVDIAKELAQGPQRAVEIIRHTQRAS